MHQYNNLLIVAATKSEIQPLIDTLGMTYTASGDYSVKINNLQIAAIVTEIGIIPTVFELTRFLAFNNPDLIVNAGICGAYNPDMQLGEVVLVKTDRFIDAGIETPGQIKPFTTENLADSGHLLYGINPIGIDFNYIEYPVLKHLKTCAAVTSSVAHGNTDTIKNIQQLFNPDIETMEGAAVMYVGKMIKIPVLQIRAVSNRVEARDKSKWNIALAIENLNKVLSQFIENVKTA